MKGKTHKGYGKSAKAKGKQRSDYDRFDKEDLKSSYGRVLWKERKSKKSSKEENY
jgi:hypothetical protein